MKKLLSVLLILVMLLSLAPVTLASEESTGEPGAVEETVVEEETVEEPAAEEEEPPAEEPADEPAKPEEPVTEEDAEEPAEEPTEEPAEESEPETADTVFEAPAEYPETAGLSAPVLDGEGVWGTRISDGRLIYTDTLYSFDFESPFVDESWTPDYSSVKLTGDIYYYARFEFWNIGGIPRSGSGCAYMPAYGQTGGGHYDTIRSSAYVVENGAYSILYSRWFSYEYPETGELEVSFWLAADSQRFAVLYQLEDGSSGYIQEYVNTGDYSDNEPIADHYKLYTFAIPRLESARGQRMRIGIRYWGDDSFGHHAEKANTGTVVDNGLGCLLALDDFSITHTILGGISVNEVSVTGFREPEIGKTAQSASSLSVPSDAHYTVAGIQWYRSGGVKMSAGSPFLGEETYYAEILIKPKSGYEFPLWQFYGGSEINGSDTVLSDCAVSGEQGGETALLLRTKEYTLNYATVSFTANGGSGSMAPEKLESTSYTLPACGFTPPEGKMFYYWMDKTTGYWWSPGRTLTIREDTVFQPVWTEGVYTISFETNGGSVPMDTYTAKYGESFTLPVCTIHPPAGKAFQWYEDQNGGEWYAGNVVTIKGDTVFRPIWGDPVTILEAGCTIAWPTAGEHPDMHPVSLDSDEYDAYIIDEYNDIYSGGWFINSWQMPENNTFTGDVNYTVRIVMTPKNGNVFSDDTVFTINGKTAVKKGSTSGRWYIEATMAANSDMTITRAGARIDEPRTGVTRSEIDETIQSLDPERYEVAVNRWTYRFEGSVITMKKSDAFVAGRTYTPVITFTAVNGYSFNSDSAFTLNGESIRKDPYYEWWYGPSFRIPGGLDYESIYIAGSKGLVNGPAWTGDDGADRMGTVSDNVLEIRYTDVKPGEYEFRFVADGDWGKSFGAAEEAGAAESGVEYDAVYLGPNNVLLSLHALSDVVIQLDLRYFRADTGTGARFSVSVQSRGPLGDADGDGFVTPADAALALRSPSACEKTLADVDGSGTVDEYDAARILQFCAGIITEFPAE